MIWIQIKDKTQFKFKLDEQQQQLAESLASFLFTEQWPAFAVLALAQSGWTSNGN